MLAIDDRLHVVAGLKNVSIYLDVYMDQNNQHLDVSGHMLR